MSISLVLLLVLHLVIDGFVVIRIIYWFFTFLAVRVAFLALGDLILGFTIEVMLVITVLLGAR